MKTYFARLQTTGKEIIDEQFFDDLTSALRWSNAYNATDDYEVEISKDHRCVLSYLHQPVYTGQ